MSGIRGVAGRASGRAFVVLAVAMFAAGCSSAVGSPSSSASTSVTPSSSPSSSPSPWQPPYATGSPDATPSPEPSPTPTEAPITAAVPDWLAGGDFEVAMGRPSALSPTDDDGRAAALQVNDFGLDLLRKLESPDKNLCVSPTSIALALAMVRAGAKGQTAQEMDRVLHAFGSDDDRAAVAALVRNLRSRTEYVDADGIPLSADASPDPSDSPVLELNLANEVFLQKGGHFEQEYLDLLFGEFNAGAGLLDFAGDPEAARKVINAWAGKQTHGRIPDVLQQGDITPATRIALANAIYFKSAWRDQFDPKNTAKRTFTTSSGAVKYPSTMSGTLGAGYHAGTGYKAVSLPYSSGFDMLVVVPTSMSSFVKSLRATTLNDIDTALRPYEVQFTMPRFSLDTRVGLAGALAEMGMPTLFGDGADLSGITGDRSLFLSAVIHQANIDVVEDGTTAAAVTIALGAATGGDMEPPPSVKFHVDRPFLYFIRDNASGAVLFQGVVNDPTTK